MKEDKQITVLVALGLLFCVLILGYAAFFAAPIQIYNITFAAAEVSLSPKTDEEFEQESAVSFPDTSSLTSQEQESTIKSSSQAVNINTATLTELMTLQGIGEVMAERIVQYREQFGEFSSVDELLNVSGIGEKKLEAIRENITVE